MARRWGCLLAPHGPAWAAVPGVSTPHDGGQALSLTRPWPSTESSVLPWTGKGPWLILPLATAVGTALDDRQLRVRKLGEWSSHRPSRAGPWCSGFGLGGSAQEKGSPRGAPSLSPRGHPLPPLPTLSGLMQQRPPPTSAGRPCRGRCAPGWGWGCSACTPGPALRSLPAPDLRGQVSPCPGRSLPLC